MGDLVVQQFVSVDGFAANEDGEFTLFDTIEGDSGDFDRSNVRWLASVDAIALGAVTYRMFSAYWPTAAARNDLAADRINALPKYVFSHTLREAPWGEHADATIESGDALEAMGRLKERTAGDVILWGSLTLSAAFFAAGLVDTVRLVVLPVALGSGRGVFPAGTVSPLRLKNSTPFASGLVEIEYTVA